MSLISGRTLLLMEVRRKTFLSTNWSKEAITHIYQNFDRQVYIVSLSTPREQKWCSGENTRLSTFYPGFKSRHRRHMWRECGLSLLLVLSPAPRGFSSGAPVFPSPQKPIIPNSNSNRNQVDEEPLCFFASSKSLFIYFNPNNE